MYDICINDFLDSVKESLRNRKPTEPGKYEKEPFSKISYESVDLDASELVVIRYSQFDDGIEMGGVLRFEKQNAAALIEALINLVYNHPQPETVIRGGADVLTIYESGTDYQPFYNVLNRRDENASGGGVSGLMLTRWAVEEMLSKLLKLQPSE